MAPKYRQIADDIRQNITDRVFPPDSMLPTEQQLCDAYSASRQTVRLALKCLMDEGLIQRRQGSGSRVLSQAARPMRRNIAVIATYISNYIFPGILREVESTLSANNCTTMLYATSNRVSDERRILTDLLAGEKLDGILVEGTKTALPNPNLDLYRRILDRNIPLIFLHGNYRELTGAVAILDDNYAGGYQLAEYLIGKGHTRIAGIFKSDDIQGHERYAGFAAALRDHHLPVEDRHIAWYSTEDKENTPLHAPLWKHKISPVLRGCTAAVCYNDEVATLVAGNLSREHVAIPGQMALVSFDNSLISNLSVCPITSLSHGDRNVGRIAAEMLLRQMDGKDVRSVLVPWTLIEKQSS